MIHRCIPVFVQWYWFSGSGADGKQLCSGYGGLSTVWDTDAALAKPAATISSIIPSPKSRRSNVLESLSIIITPRPSSAVRGQNRRFQRENEESLHYNGFWPGGSSSSSNTASKTMVISAASYQKNFLFIKLWKLG
jgi:hypothetical protein